MATIDAAAAASANAIEEPTGATGATEEPLWYWPCCSCLSYCLSYCPFDAEAVRRVLGEFAAYSRAEWHVHSKPAVAKLVEAIRWLGGSARKQSRVPDRPLLVVELSRLVWCELHRCEEQADDDGCDDALEQTRSEAGARAFLGTDLAHAALARLGAQAAAGAALPEEAAGAAATAAPLTGVEASSTDAAAATEAKGAKASAAKEAAAAKGAKAVAAKEAAAAATEAKAAAKASAAKEAAAAKGAAAPPPLTSEEARQQAQAEGLTLRVADNKTGYQGLGSNVRTVLEQLG